MKNIVLLQFIKARGAGDATIRRMADLVSHNHLTLDDVITMRTEDIAAALRITKEVASNIRSAESSARILAEEIEAQGVDIIWIADVTYPQRLRGILGGDAPPVLFVKGNQNIFIKPSIGFCGSRKASEKGIRVTERAAHKLAHNGVCVVSGYAHGVDMAAHRASLEAGGSTIIVLAEGIMRFQIKKEIETILTPQNSLIVSQFPPTLSWISHNAMKRNGTIIGLSDAMILVESGLNGGTFATGMECLKRRHTLFVIDFAHPGRVAEANPHFIARGGTPIRGNDQRMPNMNKVIDVTRHPHWLKHADMGSLSHI